LKKFSEEIPHQSEPDNEEIINQSENENEENFSEEFPHLSEHGPELENFSEELPHSSEHGPEIENFFDEIPHPSSEHDPEIENFFDEIPHQSENENENENSEDHVGIHYHVTPEFTEEDSTEIRRRFLRDPEQPPREFKRIRTGQGIGKPFFPMTEEYDNNTTEQPTTTSQETSENQKEKQIFFILKILPLFLDSLSSGFQKSKFLLMLFIAVFFPFVAVFLKTGISKYLLLNIFLCFCCFYVPGSIQALYMVLQSE